MLQRGQILVVPLQMFVIRFAMYAIELIGRIIAGEDSHGCADFLTAAENQWCGSGSTGLREASIRACLRQVVIFPADVDQEVTEIRVRIPGCCPFSRMSGMDAGFSDADE